MKRERLSRDRREFMFHFLVCRSTSQTSKLELFSGSLNVDVCTQKLLKCSRKFVVMPQNRECVIV